MEKLEANGNFKQLKKAKTYGNGNYECFSSSYLYY